VQIFKLFNKIEHLEVYKLIKNIVVLINVFDKKPEKAFKDIVFEFRNDLELFFYHFFFI